MSEAGDLLSMAWWLLKFMVAEVCLFLVCGCLNCVTMYSVYLEAQFFTETLVMTCQSSRRPKSEHQKA
jgi:hypothetical protein